MQADRYLKVVLTIIALELGWLALTHVAQPVSAQQANVQRPTPVVITGIELSDQRAYLPVGVMGHYITLPRGVGGVTLHSPRVTVDTSQAPLRVDLPVPIVVNVEPGNRPIRTEAVPYTPALRPGE